MVVGGLEEGAVGVREGGVEEGFEEVQSLQAFAGEMERRGLRGWWRVGMGYA